MKTIIINRSNVPASPLVAAESIYNVSPLFASSKPVGPWIYYKNAAGLEVNTEIELPFSINAIDGHSSSYATGLFTFTSTITIHKLQPTYLWFDHADQSAEVYIENVLVTKHWGGYNAFFIDITNYIKVGNNELTVKLKNNEGNNSAPAAGDFNFNATLGKVKLLTSPVLPTPNYGYDGFHITSTVTAAQAVMTVKTTIPTYADVVLKVNDEEFSYVERKFGKGDFTFTITIDNPHLWNGTIDPHLYDVTLEIYYNNELNLQLKRPYGLRFWSYVWQDETIDGYDSNNPYTGFLLNGHPYLLRGVCTHHDLANKANALTVEDINNDFDIITELGANFLRLAHYPHPKQVYDYCDKLGIIVQTEVQWVNSSTSTMPDAYWEHIGNEIDDLVNQHYNHPSILFWGVGNEINSSYTGTEEGKNFVKSKIEGYRGQIRSLLPGAWVGYTVSHGTDKGLQLFNYPTVDWLGSNIYVGWYVNQNSNNPSGYLNSRITHTTEQNVPMAYSEYGCGGTPTCHSEDYMNTTTRGNNPRHDIEYMMWLHEGHIAAIKNYPQLLFTSQWQLFDIAVSKRAEGYKECLDGETVTDNEELKRLNNKGLVERDHVTKKDPFYLYKAWWNPTPFVHICQKNYTKKTDRVIKCYTNSTSQFSLYINENPTPIVTATPSNNILLFTATSFYAGNVIKVSNGTIEDSFRFECDFNASILDILYSDANGNLSFTSEVLASSEGKTPIAICIAGKDFFGTGEKARWMSLKYMNYTTPETGSLTSQSIYWGNKGTDLNNLPTINYVYKGTNKYRGYINVDYYDNSSDSPKIPSVFDGNSDWNISALGTINEFAITDIDGRNNTNKILANVTLQPTWQTDESIVNSSTKGYYPAACCCARYHTLGTLVGDWYLGAGGEMAMILAKKTDINTKLASLSSIYPSECISSLDDEISLIWSSSEGSLNSAYNIKTSNGLIGLNYKNSEDDKVLAILSI